MKQLILAASLALSSVVAAPLAQAGTMQNDARIEHREMRQQQRIHEGTMRGQITPGEHRSLERGQRHVERMERRAERDGFVTRREARRIRHAENVQSAHIARARHNAWRAR